MKKIVSVLAVLLCLTLVFSACGENTTNSTTVADGNTTVAGEEKATDDTTEEKAIINLGLLKGPTGMGAAALLDADQKNAARADYEVKLEGAPDVLQTALINKELDMAALPTNVAAVLNAKTNGEIQILAVNTLGVIYIMSNDESISSVADLDGKTILSAGKGTTTEYVLNYILSENSVEAKTEFASEHAEVIAQAKAGNYDVILLPEPFVTQMKTQDAGFSVCVDLTAEWEALGGGDLTMGCIAVRKEFAENNPEAVKAFLEDYNESVSYVNGNPEAAGTIIEEFDIAKAAVASKAIPNCNMVVLTGENMKASVNAYLTVLHSAAPAAVGGSVPGDGFYCEIK